MSSGLVFTAGQMWSKINENTSAIAERKLSAKEVIDHGNRLTELETNGLHNTEVHKYFYAIDNKQDEKIESIRTRLREVESDVSSLKGKKK